MGRCLKFMLVMFQHTAARRRLLFVCDAFTLSLLVSTHSRAEAAAIILTLNKQTTGVSTHSRAEAAAGCDLHNYLFNEVSTHSRAEAAACNETMQVLSKKRFNTQPRGGGCIKKSHFLILILLFQHTAARRRLLSVAYIKKPLAGVSTHSRAEAAAIVLIERQ